jgi:hypothetical protein
MFFPLARKDFFYEAPLIWKIFALNFQQPAIFAQEEHGYTEKHQR